MRYLILTTSHGLLVDDQRMTNELVGALQQQGHLVDVLFLKWQGESRGETQVLKGPLNEDVLFVSAVSFPKSPGILQRLTKWSASPFKAAKAFRKHFSDRRYDAVISFTPAMLFRRIIGELEGKNLINILLIHDFFPIHHLEIGLVPRRSGPFLHWIENKAIAAFDIIYCNLPSNISYLEDNYTISKNQLVSWTPLWTRVELASALATAGGEDIRSQYGLPKDQPIAVFGGQLTEGRGIEDMLSASKLALEQRTNLLFLFIGSGRLASVVDTRANEPGGNVRRIAHVPRDDFLKIVSACDVGMAATVPGVTSHSFPTKIMDYLRAGIPAVVAVEPDSSLAKMVVDGGVGLSVSFGDVPGLLNALETAVHDPVFREPVAKSAWTFLQEVLDVNLVPGKIEADMARLGAAKKQEFAS